MEPNYTRFDLEIENVRRRLTRLENGRLHDLEDVIFTLSRQVDTLTKIVQQQRIDDYLRNYKPKNVDGDENNINKD